MDTSIKHQHNFSEHNHHGEKRTIYVLILTVTTMFVEIAAGTYYGSMALLADGWHMARTLPPSVLRYLPTAMRRNINTVVAFHLARARSVYWVGLPVQLRWGLSPC